MQTISILKAAVNSEKLQQEMAAAGIRDGYSWGFDGTAVTLMLDNVSQADITTLTTIIQAHDATQLTTEQSEAQGDRQQIADPKAEIRALLTGLADDTALDAIIAATGTVTRAEIKDVAREIKRLKNSQQKTLRLVRLALRELRVI
jgi:hypothetical protein